MPIRLVPIGAALFLALLILACGTTPTGGATVIPATSTPAAQATAGSAAPTSAPAAEPTAASPTVAKVGDRVELNGMALTVTKADRAMGLGGFAKPKEGNEFIVTEVIIENVSAEKVNYNLLYFKVKDADGFEYTTALGVDQPLSAGELAKGEKARGNVAFEVKKTAKGLVLEYKPLTFGRADAIKVALP